MPTLRVTPQVDARGDVYLIVILDGHQTATLGPLQDGQEIVVPHIEEKQGPAPPTRSMKKLSRKQERRNAELIGGRVQPASGALSFAKGDIRKRGEYRGESKYTFASRFILTRDVLEKITAECGQGERPILFLDFKNKETGRTRGSYVVLHETDFEELMKNGPADDR